MEWFNRAWKGEVKLWKLFWIGLVSPWVIALLCGFFAGLIIHITHWVDDPRQLIFQKMLFLNYLMPVYYILWGVLVARCYKNCSSILWAILSWVGALAAIIWSCAPLFPTPITIYYPACISQFREFARKNGFDENSYLESHRGDIAKCSNEVYRTQCISSMQAFAAKNNLDPKDYVEQNRSQLNSCIHTYANQYMKAAMQPATTNAQPLP